MCRLNDRRMFRQPQVIVGAHIDDLPTACHPNVGSLRRGQYAFVLVKTLVANRCERRAELLSNGVVHVSYPSSG